MRKKDLAVGIVAGTLALTNIMGMCAEAIYLVNPQSFHERTLDVIDRHYKNTSQQTETRPYQSSKNS